MRARGPAQDAAITRLNAAAAAQVIRFPRPVIVSYFSAAAPDVFSRSDVSQMVSADPILVVDDDPFVLGMLSHVGRARGLDVVGVQSGEEALAALATRAFGVVVVDLRLGTGSGLDVIRQVRSGECATEAIVISADRRLSSALESYAEDVFAFVPKPFDPAQLFATVERALERRKGVVERQRLTWELRLLNDVATAVSTSIEIGAALQLALDRIIAAYEVPWAVLRLRPIDGGPLEVRAVHGTPLADAQRAYATREAWPSDTVLDDLKPVRQNEISPEQLGTIGERYPIRSTVSVPVMSGVEALGVLTLVSDQPGRFDADDERVLQTIGRQVGVAVANGQLYERVHRAKVQWERTFDAISDPIALFDRQARTMRTNAALAAWRGWDIRETQGRTCADVGLCGGACPACLVGRAIGDQVQLVQEVTTADGRIFAVTTFPVPDASGAAVQFAKDVTEERRQASRLSALSQEISATNAELVATVARLRSTQAQLVQAEKLSAIGQLVAGVAHELNNPLTSVIGYAQLVHEEVTAKPALAAAGQGLLEDVTRIVSEADRAARIVRNLLTFARRQSAERSLHAISEMCNRVVDLRAYDSRLKGIEVITRYADDLPPVSVDGGQFQQALLNLVLNAEQAMRDSATKRLEIVAETDRAHGCVVVRVSDTGHGIEPANLPRIFDPFFTTRPVGEGTGLGLSIVYGIVRDHGGQVWATSELGRGTTFSIRLPVILCTEGAAPPPVVLVAHGDSVTRDFIGAALAGWGCVVRTVPTPREAVESLREDELTLAVVDRSVLDGDPEPWRDAWRAVAGRVRLLALDGGGDDEPLRELRQMAYTTLEAPFELASLYPAYRKATE
jgi:two-component system NtrC family sensor kinase